jgi:hypothetical protein
MFGSASSKLHLDSFINLTIPVTGPVGPQDCSTSRLPHSLYTDGGEVVGLTHRPTAHYRRKFLGNHYW